MPFDGPANIPPINPAVRAYHDLVAARRLIVRRRHWTQGAHVRVGWFGNIRYCASGALQLGNATPLAFATLQAQIHRRRPYLSIEGYNDHASHAAVLSMFDCAIQHLAPLV